MKKLLLVLAVLTPLPAAAQYIGNPAGRSRPLGVHRPRPHDRGGRLDPGTNGEPVDALEDRIVDRADLLGAAIRAHGVDPYDQTPEADGIDRHAVVRTA